MSSWLSSIASIPVRKKFARVSNVPMARTGSSSGTCIETITLPGRTAGVPTPGTLFAALVVAFSSTALAAQEPPRGSNVPGAELVPLPVLGGDRVTSGSAFNPGISIIVDMVQYHQSGSIEDPAGFEGGHDHGHGHGDDHGLEEGFNLRETELTFTATVDPYFDALATLAFDEHGVEVEEAYATTRNLPAGLQVKVGKFLSDVGYINAQHPHDWAFVDRPLVNEFLFGDHGLQETGVQLTWMPATPFYSQFGIELLQGESDGISPYVGAGRVEHVTVLPDADGNPVRVRWRDDNPFSDESGPRLITGFAKFGPDLGYDHAAQFGLSYGYARAFQRDDLHSSLRYESWEGSAWFAGLDAVYKYDAGRNYGHGDWVVQGEYFYREVDADFREMRFQNGSLEITHAESATARQDGLYLQALYGFAPRWQAGLRAEALGLTNRNALVEDDFFADFGTSYRYAGSVTFRPTEFSMFRAQLNRSDYYDQDPEWAFMLQFQMALGVHGAHKF
ncbi:TonB-dependent receptor [Thioalkalivibrio thiocyanodenitrificans]|uniref:TonB-dependent receptor n=1 Tax=Thioalkalivibrio thiocyanodenitrificans TaxID=243063 RepID=UPI000363299A|nr:TonB-dependent receptor [Thioalkalivibrio thiocyanodenitrificans]